MITIIASAVIAAFLIIFFLSALGPTRSRKKFWIIIQKLRAGMDAGAYWIINICAILTVLQAVWKGLSGLFG